MMIYRDWEVDREWKKELEQDYIITEIGKKVEKFKNGLKKIVGEELNEIGGFDRFWCDLINSYYFWKFDFIENLNDYLIHVIYYAKSGSIKISDYEKRLTKDKYGEIIDNIEEYVYENQNKFFN